MDQTPDRPPLDVPDLFAKAQAGDQQAWQILFDASYPKIRRVIRRRIDSKLRSVFDSSDFANDVWMSLASKPGKFDFENFEALMAFLQKSAERKLIDERRRMLALKRNVEREQPHGTRPAGEPGGLELVSPEPTPSRVYQGKETLERLGEGADSAEAREVVDLRAAGHSNEDIALQTDLHVRKVQRMLQELYRWWQATSSQKRY